MVDFDSAIPRFESWHPARNPRKMRVSWHSIQTRDDGHRRRARTSRAPERQHEETDRRERVAINRPDIDRAAGPATREFLQTKGNALSAVAEARQKGDSRR